MGLDMCHTHSELDLESALESDAEVDLGLTKNLVKYWNFQRKRKLGYQPKFVA